MNLFSFIIFFCCSFNLLVASQVTFEKVSKQEADKLNENTISHYAQELLKAGLFEDEFTALKAAKAEYSDTPLYYFNLISDELENTRFGYLSYSIDKETVYLLNIYLDPNYRGFGLGKDTMCSLEEHVKEIGISGIRLYVFEHNQVAFNLYKKMGYEIENTYFNDNSPVGHHMKKELK